MATVQSDKEVKKTFDTSVIVKSAKSFLSLLPTTDITFIETGDGESHNLPGAITGSFRVNSQALIVPVPESASMIAAFPNTVKFFVEAPKVIEELISALEAE